MAATRGLLLVRGSVCSWRVRRVLLAVGAGCSRGLALGGWAVRGFQRAAPRLRLWAEIVGVTSVSRYTFVIPKTRQPTEVTRRKESEAHQALMQINKTIKTSTELGDVERAWVTANASVATRNNIATRITGIEKKIDDLRNDQESFRRELDAEPKRIEAKKDELQRLRQRRSEEQEALARLRTQAQAVAGELAGLPKPVALMGVGIGQDDALTVRRAQLLGRDASLRSQIARVESEIAVSERLVGEAEASVGKMEEYLSNLKSQAASGGQ